MTDTLVNPGVASGAASPGSRAAKPLQILDAARELFLRDGFSATSMDAVAKIAGVSKATVYAHFSSKEELFRSMMETECSRSWPDITTGEIAKIDPIPKIWEVGQRYMRFITSGYPVSLLRVVAAEVARNPGLGQIFYDSAPGMGRTRFAQLLAHADELGLLRIPNPLQAADTFFSMLRGDIHIRCLVGMPLPGDEELAAHARTMTEMFLAFYAPKTPAD